MRLVFMGPMKSRLHGQSVTISVDVHGYLRDVYGVRISVDTFRHHEDIEKFQIDNQHLRIHRDISWYHTTEYASSSLCSPSVPSANSAARFFCSRVSFAFSFAFARFLGLVFCSFLTISW